jgi:hypothetical protein
VAQALVQDGANINIRNSKDETPLIHNFSAEVTKLPVAASTDVDARAISRGNAKEIELEGKKVRFLKSLNSGTPTRP